MLRRMNRFFYIQFACQRIHPLNAPALYRYRSTGL
jgi:hypothetical protein